MTDRQVAEVTGTHVGSDDASGAMEKAAPAQGDVDDLRYRRATLSVDADFTGSSTDDCGLPGSPVKVGTKITHHEIIRLLGRGGMGQVYLARDVRLGRLVALKFLNETSPSRAERFVAEARTTAQLTHENIVSLYDIGEHDGLLYMVLEYVKGQTLKDWLDERAQRIHNSLPDGGRVSQLALPPSRAAELMLPVVRALVHAHEAGLIHRDLKPSNIMLTESGMVKVLDFGIAKLIRGPVDLTKEPKSSKAPEPRTNTAPLTQIDTMNTRTGALVGTVPYMSPEQWGAAEVDRRADLWAVGIMLYEMVTGHHPLAPLSPESLKSVADLTIPMPSARNERADLGKLGALIDRCLIKHKEDRIGSASLLLAELESIPRGELRIDCETENPYAGLAAFQERDANRFFGRGRAIAQVVARLSVQPLIAIVGPSGAGKSSFVRAGVIPALKHGGDAWEAFIVRPGPRPLIALAELLVQYACTHSSQEKNNSLETSSNAPNQASGAWSRTGIPVSARSERDAVCERLLREPGYLGAELRVRAQRSLERIVLFIDQFEELYTLASAEQREAFLKCLAGAADDVSSPLRVMLSLRSDFLDRMADAPPSIIDQMSRGTILIRPMDREQLRSALTKPAEAAEHRFESSALVEEMLDALSNAAGALPLLQFTAARMWVMRDVERRVLTETSYRAIGGVAGALASHADAVLDSMSVAERKWARAVLLRLVTPERTRVIATMSELRELSGTAAPDDLDRVVVRLIEARLLTVEGTNHDESTVEIVHESLVTHWPTLTRWLEEDTEDAAFLARLRSAAREWRASGEGEGLLWTGEAAAEAARFAARHHGELTLAEGSFLKAVIALARRARARRRQMLMAVIASVIVFTLSVTYMAIRANREAEHAERGAARARNASRMAAARENQDDPTMVLSLVRELEPGPSPRGWSEIARWALDAGVVPIVLPHDNFARTAEFSPDGRRIVTASWDKIVRVWRADGVGQPILIRGHDDVVNSAAFSPDGHRIVSTSHDKTVRVWNADGSGEPLVLRGHDHAVTSARFSPDGRRIVSASFDKTVRVWNADGSGEPLILRGHEERIDTVGFSPDGRRIVSGSHDKTVRVWNADGSGDPLILRGHSDPVNSSSFSPDGHRIVTAGWDKTVRVWNADGSGEPLVLRGHENWVRSAVFSPDGRRIASASYDKTVRVWNADGSGAPLVLRGHKAGLYWAAFSPDGHRIVSTSWDNTARVWNTDSVGQVLNLRGHTEPLLAATFSPDGRRIVSASYDKTARVWNVDGSGEVLILRGHNDVVKSAAFSPNGRRIATASGDKTVRVWSADNAGAPLVVLRGHEDAVNSVEFSPDGRHIVTASGDKTVRVWNTDGSGEPLVLRGHDTWVNSAAFSPDGYRIVSASYDRTVRVWNTDGSGEPLVLRGHEDLVNSAAFSPDGRRIASGSGDKTVRVWNADGSGEPLVLRGHEGVVSLAGGRPFSPDGTKIVSSSIDLTVRVWNADGTGEPLLLRGSTHHMYSAAFSPDGTQIVAASDDTMVWVWHGGFEPLLGPDDPRLWTATTYCLPIVPRMRLLDIPEEMARADLARCEERVRKTHAQSAFRP